MPKRRQIAVFLLLFLLIRKPQVESEPQPIATITDSSFQVKAGNSVSEKPMEALRDSTYMSR